MSPGCKSIRWWKLSPLAAVLLSGSGYSLWAQEYRTTSAFRQARGESHLTVQVEYGAGQFRLSVGPDRSLYRLNLRYDASIFRPVHQYDRTTGRLRVGVEGQNRELKLGKRDLPEQKLELEISPSIPTELELAFGGGSAEMELGGLTLVGASLRTGASATRLSFESPNRTRCEQLSLEAGAVELKVRGLGNSRCQRIDLKGAAGDVVLDFSGTWPDSAEMEVDLAVGVGALTLELPRSVGVAARVNQFLASFDRSGLRRVGDRYYSPNYESAAAKLALHIKAALGSIQLRWRD